MRERVTKLPLLQKNNKLLWGMNVDKPLNRGVEVQRAKDESERSDLKQHADKMLRDFEKFNDFSSNRAIWELVQNACDLTVHCNVTIDYRNNQFSFTHNGRAFNSNSLISLIKQVSGDKDGNSEIPPVGKYGTGFLTTHSLGRKFIINSILQSSSGHFIEIKDFLIDRSPKKWEDLSEQIRLQKDRVFEIIDKAGKVVENPELLTTFTYLPETEQEIKYVAESYRDLEEYIPIVLTINNRLKSVKLISPEGTVTDFTLSSKEEIPNEADIKLYRTFIRKNNEESVIHSISEPVDEVEIILPVDKNLILFEFPNRVARLFLYYPLIGSEDLGINFIINCNQFLPTEQRDGLHLNSNKDQVKDQERINKILIDKASELLFRFLNSNVLPVTNPLLYANINFKRTTDNVLLNEYFTELQQKWVDHFKNLDIVETKSDYKKVTEVTFLDPALLENVEYFESIYYLFDKFYTDIPSQQTIRYWSLFVSKWEYTDTVFIGNDDIAKQIQECSLSDLDDRLLKKYYEYLLSERHTDLFTENKLLPNIEGEFQYLNTLKQLRNLDSQLLTIGKTLIPDAMAQLINRDFSFDFKFDAYGRKDFSNSVNAKLSTEFTDNCICLPEVYNTDDYVVNVQTNTVCLNREYFLEVLNYCKLHNKSKSLSRPSKLMGLISDYYHIDKGLLQLEPVANKEDDIDIRQAQKSLVKVFFSTLERHTQTWVKNNMPLLLDIAFYNEDRYREVYSTSKIYPSQLHKLCYLTELKKAINFDPGLKKAANLDGNITELYNRTSGKIIEGALADIKFNDFLLDNETVTNKTLSTAIEEIFFETDIRDVNEHPFKEDILNIISNLNTSYYKDLFPRLDDKKAIIMLDIVTNESTKDDIFSIVTLKEEQLKKLGRIVQLPNFEEILLQAEDVVRLEKERKSDFEHKYKIGTYIEDKIREKLGAAISSKLLVEKDKKVGAEDVQGGQDIIIYYGDTALYFIEVKSRWDSRNSVSMSKLQLEKASENADKYSLISVDITKYKGVNDRYELPLEEIIPLIKVIDKIGKNVHPLITNNLVAERDLSSAVKLVDYRGIVNQDFINAGENFDGFVDKLINHIQLNLPNDDLDSTTVS
jgi:hypothetical protein